MLYEAKIDINNINSSHTKIIKMIDDNSTVLDVGCACGDIGEYLYKNKGCKVVGVEYNSQSLECAKQKNIYQELFQLDLNDLNSTNMKLDKFRGAFDCIVCGDILEHLQNPLEVVNNLKNYLKDDGYFVISLPNIAHGAIKLNLLNDNFNYTDSGLLDETHIKFFTQSTIFSFLLKARLELLQFNRVFQTFEVDNEKVRMSDYPKEIIEYIAKDDKSFVYQYVFKAQKAASTGNEINELKSLNETNTAQMQISTNELKGLQRCKQRTFERLYCYSMNF